MLKIKRNELDVELELYGLPKRRYKHGYTYQQIQEATSKPEFKRFCNWMEGQTCTLEKGKVVVYSWDILRFLRAYRKQGDIMLLKLAD